MVWRHYESDASWIDYNGLTSLLVTSEYWLNIVIQIIHLAQLVFLSYKNKEKYIDFLSWPWTQEGQ